MPVFRLIPKKNIMKLKHSIRHFASLLEKKIIKLNSPNLVDKFLCEMKDKGT